MTRMTSLTAAASRGELGGDATRTRLIASPDAAAKREGTFVSKRNASLSSRNERYTEHGAEGLFGEDAGLGGNTSEERRLRAQPRHDLLRPVKRGSAGECVFDLGAKIRFRVLGQRAEVCIWISINAKLRDAML